MDNSPDIIKRVIFDDPYGREDDSDIVMGDIIMQKYKMIEDQIIPNEPSNIPIVDLFIIQHEKSTNKEE